MFTIKDGFAFGELGRRGIDAVGAAREGSGLQLLPHHTDGNAEGRNWNRQPESDRFEAQRKKHHGMSMPPDSGKYTYCAASHADGRSIPAHRQRRQPKTRNLPAIGWSARGGEP